MRTPELPVTHVAAAMPVVHRKHTPVYALERVALQTLVNVVQTCAVAEMIVVAGPNTAHFY